MLFQFSVNVSYKVPVTPDTPTEGKSPRGYTPRRYNPLEGTSSRK